MPDLTPAEQTPSAERSKFSQLLTDAVNNGVLVRLVLSKYCGEETDLVRLVVRPVVLRDVESLSFVYSYKTRDITKNHPRAGGLALIDSLLGAAMQHRLALPGEIQLRLFSAGEEVGAFERSAEQ